MLYRHLSSLLNDSIQPTTNNSKLTWRVNSNQKKIQEVVVESSLFIWIINQQKNISITGAQLLGLVVAPHFYAICRRSEWKKLIMDTLIMKLNNGKATIASIHLISVYAGAGKRSTDTLHLNPPPTWIHQRQRHHCLYQTRQLSVACQIAQK